MTEKIYALNLTYDEWTDWLAKELNQPKFRAGQICQWLWQKHAFDADEMTNLSLPLREQLKERADFSAPVLVTEQRSKLDGTRKYLWQLRDGETIESVLLKQGDRLTACISTQVGCPLQCTFCATGLSGFVRNLTAGEIAGQFLAMEKLVEREINNVVYMGMGEPFLNTDNVLLSVRLLNDEKLRNLGIRHITISTSGVIPGIEALADSGLGVRLAVSLHAAEDGLRTRLMPVNQTYPLDELRQAMVAYQEKTGDRITIEYALFGGVNDSVDHARQLLRFLKGIHVFINLIPFNAVDERYEKPRPEDILRFRTVIETAGFECELRQEQGADIDAACGQLRRKTAAGVDLDFAPGPRIKAVRETHEERRLPQSQIERGKAGGPRFGEPRGERPEREEQPRGAEQSQREYKPRDDRREHSYRSRDARPDRNFRSTDEKKGRGGRPFRDEQHGRGERPFREERAEHGYKPFRDEKREQGERPFREENSAHSYKRYGEEHRETGGRGEAAKKTWPQKAKFGRRDDSERRAYGDRSSDRQEREERRGRDENFRYEHKPSARTERAPKDHYRSGKPKEARPSYRGQGEQQEFDHRGYKPRAPRMPGMAANGEEHPRRSFGGDRPRDSRGRSESGRGENGLPQGERKFAPRGEKSGRAAEHQNYGRPGRGSDAKAGRKPSRPRREHR